MATSTLLCLLVLGVAKTCTLPDSQKAACLDCCPDVVCPAAPPCPKIDCGGEEEDETEVPEPTVYKGPVEYQAIAWASIAMTFVPLTILWFIDKVEVSKAAHTS